MQGEMSEIGQLEKFGSENSLELVGDEIVKVAVDVRKYFAIGCIRSWAEARHKRLVDVRIVEVGNIDAVCKFVVDVAAAVGIDGCMLAQNIDELKSLLGYSMMLGVHQVQSRHSFEIWHRQSVQMKQLILDLMPHGQDQEWLRI